MGRPSERCIQHLRALEARIGADTSHRLSLMSPHQRQGMQSLILREVRSSIQDASRAPFPDNECLQRLRELEMKITRSIDAIDPADAIAECASCLLLMRELTER